MKIIKELKVVEFKMGADFTEKDLCCKAIPPKEVSFDSIKKNPENFYLRNSFIFSEAEKIGFETYKANYPLIEREGKFYACIELEKVF